MPHLKVLEAKDVKDTDGLEVVPALDFLVYFHDDPGETLGVQGHGHRVPGVHGLQRNNETEALQIRLARDY